MRAWWERPRARRDPSHARRRRPRAGEHDLRHRVSVVRVSADTPRADPHPPRQAASTLRAPSRTPRAATRPPRQPQDHCRARAMVLRAAHHAPRGRAHTAMQPAIRQNSTGSGPCTSVSGPKHTASASCTTGSDTKQAAHGPNITADDKKRSTFDPRHRGRGENGGATRSRGVARRTKHATTASPATAGPRQPTVSPTRQIASTLGATSPAACHTADDRNA